LSFFLLAQPRDAHSQKKTPAKKKAISGAADELLKPPPRPKRPELRPSRLPLEWIQGERIALIGSSTAERFNLFGHFEAYLHMRFPQKELLVRNFARPADEVALRQRANDYYKLDDPIRAFGPDTFLCFFGFNESFAGEAGVAKFMDDYERFLDEFSRNYPRDDAGSPPRFVLVSPIAFEPSSSRLAPDASNLNANLKRYAEAVKAVAEKRRIAFIDLFAPTLKAFSDQLGHQFTINGCHANEAGDRLIGSTLDELMFSGPNPAMNDSARFEKVRNAVNDKSWVHLQDYRMLNGWYVYGGRRTYDTETFPREYLKIRNMVAVRDRYIHDLVRGKPVADKPDDSKTGELIVPPTRFGQVTKSERPDGPTIRTPDEFLKSVTVPPGFEIKLFADEKQFPEIAKPVQMSFDNKGRLWVSTMPSYPQWRPGDPPPRDKIVILEDTNNDGKADKLTVFFDKLHCPTGFEFVDGGVLVVDQPRLIWLKDTNGDDKADVVVHALDGWATEDTHHTIGAFESNHGGLLHMLEGIAMSTAVETPWGAFRNFGSSGCYVVDPRTWRIQHYNTPGYGNPWCYVFNEWGQGFCGDGTGANQHWDTPLSGAQYSGRKGLNPVFNTEGMRPVVGSEFLVSGHFPVDVQRQFIYACVINTNGMPRWTFSDDGAGYKGIRVRHNPNDPKTPFDLIKSTDKHFRPVDPQIGPDGALWFGDWAAPLIGHMQYSQRDPHRDHVHGRIYRLVNTNKPLLTPVTQFGKSTAEVLNQLNEYEWRTRARARTELRQRPAGDVLAATAAWLAKLDSNAKNLDRLRCEALWVQQGHHAVDLNLVKQILACPTADARAAAVRVVADERDYLPGAFDLLKAATADSHPRVVTEALRGLSYFPTSESAEAVLIALKRSNDPYVKYTGEAALGANIPGWRPAFLKGELAKGDATSKKLLDGILAMDKKGAQVVPYLQILLGKNPTTTEERNRAIQAIADMKGGNAENGKAVFRRNCIACHKVFGEGADYGPAMEKVASRLTRHKLVESIVNPNADIDPKFLTTFVALTNGKNVSGLLVSETKESLEIFDGKEKRIIRMADIEERRQLKQSSMPEGLAGAMSPIELLDVVEFLSKLR
jgi:putative heme-binding domain-containing protein